MQLFATVEEVIADLEKGRYQAVLFAGEKRFYYSPSQFDVDTIDILRELEYLEVPFKFQEINYEKLQEIYNDDAYEYLEHCIQRTWGNVSKEEGNNTYNWNAMVSNNIQYRLYEVSERVIAVVEIHLHGDVRANYSPWIILSCTYEEFFEALCAASKYVRLETEKWTADITTNACSEVMVVDAKTTQKDENDNPQWVQFETCETEPEYLYKAIEEELGLS